MRFVGSCEKNSIKRTVPFFAAKLGGEHSAAGALPQSQARQHPRGGLRDVSAARTGAGFPGGRTETADFSSTVIERQHLWGRSVLQQH